MSQDEELDPSLLELSPSTEEPAELAKLPKQVYIFPLNRRPFFPGMAAPIVIEAGPFYEVLKMIAKSDQKYLGLFLTKEENIDPYDVNHEDIYPVGVLARILRIIPMDKQGAQVVLNMEQRIEVSSMVKRSKYLKARISILEDKEAPPEILKAYSISIISTIKELLKLKPFI